MVQRSKTELRIRRQTIEFLKIKPLESIKVTEIVSALGLHRSTFYQYYDSVYDVIQQIEDDIIGGFEQSLTSLEPDAHLSAYSILKREREAIMVLLGDYGENYYKIRTLKTMQNRHKNLIQSQCQNNQKEYQAIQLVNEFLSNGKLFMALQWIQQEDFLDVHEMSLLTTKLETASYSALKTFLQEINAEGCT